MAVGFSNTNKPLNPRGNDQSPLAYNRAKLFSGKALDFDGVNDVVTIHEATDLWTGDFSVSWYGDLDATGNFFAFSSGTYTGSAQAGINIWYGGASTLNFSVHFPETDGTGQQGYNLTLAESYKYWHRIDLVFVSSSRLLSLYQNGILVDSATIASNVDAAYMPNGWEFGRSYGGSFPLNGKLTNLKAFNTALTAAQVADLYNNPEKVVPTGADNTALKLWLPMQEGAGTTAYDGSGNGNHGTISGATYVHGIGAPVSQTAVIDWNKGTNLVPYSEEINESVWTKTNVTITADQTTAPDGQTTADEVLFLGNGLSQFIGRNASATAGEDYTISVYAKYVDQQWLQFTSSTSQFPAYYANFDIQNGVTGTISGATGSISDAGNGWYRINVTMTAHSSGSNTAIFVLSAIDSGTATRGASLTATNKTAYVWGAQGEQADAIGPYVRTGATAQTSPVLLPQGLTTGRDITGVNLFENVRKQGALNLDGNSWAEVHDNESLDFGTGSFSLEVWSKAKYISSGSIYNVLLTLGDNVSSGSTSSLYIDSSLNYTFRYDSTLIVASGSSEGDWSHVVGVYDGTNINIYLNGSFVVQAAASATSKTNTYSKRIGTDTAGASRTYKDQIAQPRIYNRALTAAEVLQNYNSGKNTYK